MKPCALLIFFLITIPFQLFGTEIVRLKSSSSPSVLKSLKVTQHHYLSHLDLYLVDSASRFDSESIEFREEEQAIDVASLPDDPLWGAQWSSSEGADLIGLSPAWAITTGASDIIVAILDTGIDPDHADLYQNVWVNEGEKPNNGIDDDTNGMIDDSFGYDFFADKPDPIDDSGHGTHLAGIIGAMGNNGVGMAGVNWQVRLLSLKVTGANGVGNTAAALKAIDYALAQGAQVINASWVIQPREDGSLSLESFRWALQKVEEADVLFVTAAGNSKSEASRDLDLHPVYPASFDSPILLSVAASTDEGALASFSNYGRQSVDLGAPGVSVFSTLPDDNYGRLSGTSMATAFVSGSAALLLSNHPEWNVSDVITALKETAHPSTSLQGQTVSGGVLNVGDAIQYQKLESQAPVLPSGCTLIPH